MTSPVFCVFSVASSCFGSFLGIFAVRTRFFAMAELCLGQSFGLELQASGGFSSALGILLLGAVSALILKCFGFRGAPLVGVAALLLAVSCYGEALGEIFGIFSYLSDSSGASEYVSAALKVVGISYLSGISIDVCREIGEGGIAKGIALLTRLELILLSLPYIKEILSSVSSLA